MATNPPNTWVVVGRMFRNLKTGKYAMPPLWLILSTWFGKEDYIEQQKEEQKPNE